jgi:hypothetical protein
MTPLAGYSSQFVCPLSAEPHGPPLGMDTGCKFLHFMIPKALLTVDSLPL